MSRIITKKQKTIKQEKTFYFSRRVWFFLGLSFIFTFVCFMTLDPNPNLLLSICASANFSILLGSIYLLYKLELLLSPMMLIFIGPPMILYYSWGNLGVRIAGETGYARNFGTLEYYPITALLSTIGLILYCLFVFSIFKKSFSFVKIKYKDLIWNSGQALLAIFLSIMILVYLSTKYTFTGGYFRNTSTTIDSWFVASLYSFIFLVVLISVSVLAKANNNLDQLTGLIGIILSIIISVGLRSRTFIVIELMFIVLCWLSLKPEQAKPSFFLSVVLVVLVVFSFGTAVKYLQGETESIIDNLSVVSEQETSQIILFARQGFSIDSQYRTGGFEFPSAILRCLDNGASPSYGQGLFSAAWQGLPGFIRPIGIRGSGERAGIALHFWRYCFFTDDSMAIPLASGLGDWGFVGVIIYVLFAVFSMVLWKVAQISPRLFLSYLLVPFLPDYLFWTGVFTYIKTMAFMWLFLLAFGSLFMPRWIDIKSTKYSI